MVNLVKIEGNKFSFFDKGKRIISVTTPDMDKTNLELYRKNPKQIELDINAAAEAEEIESKELENLELTSLPKVVVDDMIQDQLFLSEHVLKGMTKEQWLEINYTSTSK